MCLYCEQQHTGIVKEIVDMMQVWAPNESTCPAAVRQSPDGTLNIHDVDFYIWTKKISPKEDAKLFKQQFIYSQFQIGSIP